MCDDNELDWIRDFVVVTADIICVSCNKKETLHDVDDYDAAELFKNKGWRVTKYRNVYCPECANKKLKR